MRTTKCFLFSVLHVALLSLVSQAVAVPITGDTGPGGFEPTGVSSDLTLWLRGDAGLSTSGSAVTAWADQSGHSNNVSQGDTNKQPVQTTSMNSIPLISFDGGGVTDPTNNADFMTTAGSVSAQSIHIMNVTNGFSSCCNPIISNSGFLSIRYTGAGWQHPGDANDFTNPVSSTFDVNGASGTAAAQGVAHVLHATRVSAFAFNSFRLAQHNGLQIRSWEGDMGEVVVFDRALDSVETVLVDNYLSSKFNVPLAAGERYSGDTALNNEHDFDVFGIGNDGSNSVTNSGSSGFGFEANAGVAAEDLNSGEWILAGHDGSTNAVLPLSGTTELEGDRWQRTWYVDTNGSNVDTTLAFNFDDSGIGGSYNALDSFSLLYTEANDPTGWTIRSQNAVLEVGDVISFALSGDQLIDGIYTLGINVIAPVPEPSSLLLLGLGLVSFAHNRRRKRSEGTLSTITSTDSGSKSMNTQNHDSLSWTRALALVAVLVALLLTSTPAQATLIGSSSSNPGLSAKQILDHGASVGDGVYWIDPDGAGGNAPFQAYADMTTNGGGWTLMTYAGTIPTTKTALVGGTDWFPVFHNFGTYDPNALSTNNAFSRRDLVDDLFVDSTQILAYRSSNLDNQMIFPVADRTSWLGGILPDISYLTLTNDGTNYVTHPGSELAVFNQVALPIYTGYDWNVTGNNSDGFGSYGTALNHRSLLYWEALDNTTYDQQWFHGTALSLAPSAGPVNDFQDIAFFLREDVTYTIPEPSSLLLLGLGAMGLLRRTRVRRRNKA